MSVVAGILDNGTWAACFGLSYRDTQVRNPGVVTNECRHVAGSGQIAAGRNHLVEVFLEHTTGDFLWFADTDMGFNHDALSNLHKRAVDGDLPIVGGLCFGLKRVAPGPMHSEQSAMYPTLFRREATGYTPIWDYPRDQVVPVDATGAAFLLLHRDVLTKLDDWFTTDGSLGEDLAFCARATEAGFPIHVDTSVKTVHRKGFFYLSEALYDQMRGGHVGVG